MRHPEEILRNLGSTRPLPNRTNYEDFTVYKSSTKACVSSKFGYHLQNCPLGGATSISFKFSCQSRIYLDDMMNIFV